MARRTRAEIIGEYYKERKSILNRRRYITNKYGIYTQDIQLPSIPEKITAKSLKSLEATRRKLEVESVKRSILPSREKGKYRPDIPTFNTIALYRLQERLSKYNWALGGKVLRAWITKIESLYGTEALARALERAEQMGISLTDNQLFGYKDNILPFIRELTNLMSEAGVAVQDDEIDDIMNEMEEVQADLLDDASRMADYYF